MTGKEKIISVSISVSKMSLTFSGLVGLIGFLDTRPHSLNETFHKL